MITRDYKENVPTSVPTHLKTYTIIDKPQRSASSDPAKNSIKLLFRNLIFSGENNNAKPITISNVLSHRNSNSLPRKYIGYNAPPIILKTGGALKYGNIFRPKDLN